MRSCGDCGYYHGGHHEFCPTPNPKFRGRFAAGWSDGRSRKPLDEGKHPAYVLGWNRGDAAADEAENSVPWSG